MNSQVWWFVARSSGIIAWALLTLSVVWGLLLSTKVSATRIAARKLRPAWILDLHRHLGGLAVIFTAIHLIGIAADSYVTFGWADIFVPMASEWKPGAVAFGVVSLYLLLAIEATSLAIRRLPRTAWRWVHRTSFVLYATATYHGILAGTDAGNQWFRVASWISIVVVTVLTARLLVVLRRKSVSDRRRHETPEAVVVPLPGPLPTPMVMPMPSPTLVPMPSPTLSPTLVAMPSPAPSVAPLAMPLVAAIPPLPGTVTELAAPLGAVTVKRPSAPTEPPTTVSLPTLGPPTVTPSPQPPPPPPPRPPHRALAEVSSGGRGGDDLAPPPGTT